MDSSFNFQQSVVEQELRELEAARTLLPPLEQSRWHDSASVAYTLHLLHLTAQAEALLAKLREARAHARQAVTTMAAR